MTIFKNLSPSLKPFEITLNVPILSRRFGINTGLIVNSSLKSKPDFYIRCIKKKPDGSWEKPTAGEGKVIKCSLDEIVMILEVLNRRQLNWTSFHTYKDIKTSISFGWEDESAKTLWINIANYSKMLNFAQAEIFRLLLTHILKEKIKYATQGNRGNSNNIESGTSSEFKDTDYRKIEQTTHSIETRPIEKSIDQTIEIKSKISNSSSQNIPSNDMTTIMGTIKGKTAKALLITFKTGQEIWIPKSTIHSEFNPEITSIQSFLMDNWVLKRNKIIAAV